ncbi:hypothetical protein BsWGS_27983 [Bradybaena similaris]
MGKLGAFCALLLLLVIARGASGKHRYDDDDDDDDDDDCKVVRLLSRVKKDDSKYVNFRVDKMRILKEFKDGRKCRRKDYGFDGRKVYAKNGCRAKFEVCPDSDRHTHRRHWPWHRHHGHKRWHRRHGHKHWHRRHGRKRWHRRHGHRHWHHHRHHEKHRHTHYYGKDWHHWKDLYRGRHHDKKQSSDDR